MKANALTKQLKDWLWPIIAGVALGFALLSGDKIAPNPTVNTEAQDGYRQAVNHAAPAVVSIYSRKVTESSEQDRAQAQLSRNLGVLRQDENESTVLGSGVVIRSDGYIATNRHVIADATDILVVFADGREARAELLGDDAFSDLAVLKVEFNNLHTLALEEPSEIFVGDIVLAIGNPFGVGLTVTQGIISATERLNINSGASVYLQTDAAINPGNSGGPLVNTNGELVGISTSVLGSRTEGISFAIPTSTIKYVVESIIENGRVSRGWLGISGGSLTNSLIRSLGLPTEQGLGIIAVAPNGPADLAGLQAGDIIIGWGGSPLTSPALVARQVATAEAGQKLELTVWRNGRSFKAELIVAEQPSE
ncbi:S1C family serine protease [Umboniibacter marinipuniceus]|uniref:Serine protease DegS/serine protease DegQ n=1 Tax=Umboniibacter marinipuniceus TaxID=569599 RepID=A0A3M0AAS4_9GAMM|nr:trypsin-like peptidase domain-containing protein [Umboniibacter marinipuniceus]RMA79495.1 serine protease DegS/serine protease DegQ [Umboniibacter marinipuniceus]